jgi:hypothetical protein
MFAIILGSPSNLDVAFSFKALNVVNYIEGLLFLLKFELIKFFVIL